MPIDNAYFHWEKTFLFSRVQVAVFGTVCPIKVGEYKEFGFFFFCFHYPAVPVKHTLQLKRRKNVFLPPFAKCFKNTKKQKGCCTLPHPQRTTHLLKRGLGPVYTWIAEPRQEGYLNGAKSQRLFTLQELSLVLGLSSDVLTFLSQYYCYKSGRVFKIRDKNLILDK